MSGSSVIASPSKLHLPPPEGFEEVIDVNSVIAPAELKKTTARLDAPQIRRRHGRDYEREYFEHDSCNVAESKRPGSAAHELMEGSESNSLSESNGDGQSGILQRLIECVSPAHVDFDLDNFMIPQLPQTTRLTMPFTDDDCASTSLDDRIGLTCAVAGKDFGIVFGNDHECGGDEACQNAEQEKRHQQKWTRKAWRQHRKKWMEIRARTAMKDEKYTSIQNKTDSNSHEKDGSPSLRNGSATSLRQQIDQSGTVFEGSPIFDPSSGQTRESGKSIISANGCKKIPGFDEFSIPTLEERWGSSPLLAHR